MIDDGVALHMVDHPVDNSVLEFCRAHRGAMGAVPTTPEGCAMIARLINEYLLLAEGEINEDALETVEIELPEPVITPEMMAAGVSAVQANQGSVAAGDLVRAVYMSMVLAR